MVAIWSRPRVLIIVDFGTWRELREHYVLLSSCPAIFSVTDHVKSKHSISSLFNFTTSANIIASSIESLSYKVIVLNMIDCTI